MAAKICFFEDQYLKNFHPLTLTRPLYDLRIGILSLGEKWLHALNRKKSVPAGILRESFKGLFVESVPDEDEILWINPRFLPDSSLKDTVKKLEINQSLQFEGDLIAALISKEIHQKWAQKGINAKDTEAREASKEMVRQVTHVWNLFQLNGPEIAADISRMNSKSGNHNKDFPRVYIENADKVIIEEGAKIEPGVVIIADKGPVYIGKNALIMANSVLRGPVAICEGATVKAGTKIYEETTIGPVCKVAGEISNSIFHSYCNKAHDGFVGNSLFGQWCNLGADTNTSNLKNNYSTVRLTDWDSGEEKETEQQFIGTVMGDHSKTGINAMLNTGTVCGVSSNIFTSGYPPKLIPSFRWVSDYDIENYKLDKAIETMRRMMARRDVELTPEYEQMMRSLANE